MSVDQDRANAFIGRLKAFPQRLPNPHAKKPQIAVASVHKVPSQLEEENSWQGMRKQSKRDQEEAHDREEFNQHQLLLTGRPTPLRARLFALRDRAIREEGRIPEGVDYIPRERRP